MRFDWLADRQSSNHQPVLPVIILLAFRTIINNNYNNNLIIILIANKHDLIIIVIYITMMIGGLHYLGSTVAVHPSPLNKPGFASYLGLQNSWKEGEESPASRMP